MVRVQHLWALLLCWWGSEVLLKVWQAKHTSLIQHKFLGIYLREIEIEIQVHIRSSRPHDFQSSRISPGTCEQVIGKGNEVKPPHNHIVMNRAHNQVHLEILSAEWEEPCILSVLLIWNCNCFVVTSSAWFPGAVSWGRRAHRRLQTGSFFCCSGGLTGTYFSRTPWLVYFK